MTLTRRRAIIVAWMLSPILLCAPASAQVAGSSRAELVGYWNEQDATPLSASLTLPGRPGPHPAVVLLSIAGTDPLVQRLVADGYAVLIPERRGFVAVEPLLQATFSTLAGDVRAALGYMDSRPDIDGGALGLVAQAEDTPPAMLAIVASERRVPLVLLAPPAFAGVETFRREQRWAAERAGFGPEALEALDEYVRQISKTVLGESEVYIRRYRLESVRAGSSVELPRNAAFPSDDRQMDFFASPLWHDRLAFEPESVLAGIRSPLLVMIGADDPNTQMDEYLSVIRRGLSASATEDATVCRIPGRTRHVFTSAGVRGIADWIGGHVRSSSEAGVATDLAEAGRMPLAGCLDDDDEGR